MIVSAVLGHASPAFTVAIYQHAWQEAPHEAAAAPDKALAPDSVSDLADVGNPLAHEVLEPAE